MSVRVSAVLETQIGLFDAPPTTRRHDPATSFAAAKRVEWTITLMQQAVLQHIKQMGPVTAAELEDLPVFSKCAPSTVRKRVSELKLADPPRITCVGKAAYTNSRGRRTYGEAYVVAEAKP
jgi:hypothetical protein